MQSELPQQTSSNIGSETTRQKSPQANPSSVQKFSAEAQPIAQASPPLVINIIKASPKRALDLFSGTGAVARTLESLGWEVVTLDWNPRAQAQIAEDILVWDVTKYPPKFFDLIAAGVPCEEYSRAKTTAPRNLALADSIVQRTLKIIRYFAPTMWWIENPRWGELRNRRILDGVGYVDVDYCCFSDWGYKKPTRIWGSPQIATLEDQLCQQSKCPHVGENGRHKLRLGGNEMKVGTWLKGRMPESLILFLLSSEPSFGVDFSPKKHFSSRWVQKTTLSTKIAPGSPAWCQERVGSGVVAAAAPGFYPPSTTTLPGSPAWCQEGVELGVTTPAFSTISVKTFPGGPAWCQEKAEIGNKAAVTSVETSVQNSVQSLQRRQSVPGEEPENCGQVRGSKCKDQTEAESGRKKQQVVRTYKIDSSNKAMLQLMLKVDAQLEDGTSKFLQVLVDTGAQTNLLKTGVVPFRCTQKSSEPLELIAANGEIIRGGDRETTLTLRFETVAHDGSVEKQKILKAKFHIADIGVDAILAYPWLTERKVGIFPHLKSLALPHPEQKMLRPTTAQLQSQETWNDETLEDDAQIAVIAKRAKRDKRGEFWETERYQVRSEVVQEILQALEVVPTVDAFADSETHIFPRWWGEGGECLDAFQTSWCPEVVGCIWANPPFSRLQEVTQKIVQDKARVVLVCPDWRNLKWWKKVQALVVKEFFIPKGTLVFQSPDKDKLRSTRWGVWAYLVDGALTEVPWQMLWNVTKDHHKSRPQATISMFSVRSSVEEPEEERIEKLRRKIMEQYSGTVLTSTIPQDPPKRGPYGEAKILLREGAIPVRQKPFMLHGEKAEGHKKVVREWLDNGYLELAGDSEWLSMTFPVPKKNPGEWRGVVDLRGPNEQTRPTSHPLPIIENLLVKMGAKQMFSILDLKQAFHQQPLEKESRPITACWTPFGVYQWKVNVMGLKNAPQQFQRMMDWVLVPVSDVAVAYMDDILVGTVVENGGDLIAQHEKDICRVLDRLAEQKLVVDPKKCTLFTREVEFCGHVLSNGTRRPMPKKLNAIQNWEAPRNVTQLRAFLGFTNYYANYIPGYATLAAPLQEKLKVPRGEGKKGSTKPIQWTENDDKIFENLKAVMCQQLSLNRIDPDRPFVLRTDASKYAVGAVLEQLPEGHTIPSLEDVLEKRTKPVGFMSRKLTQGQQNWTPREQETYAVILALKKWANIIGSQPVTIITDHKSLEEWHHETLDTPSGPLGRRSRWHEFLSRFDVSVVYLPGKTNDIADCLSRWAYPASQALKDVSKHGSLEDKSEMKQMEEQEIMEEAGCLMVQAIPKNSPSIRTCFVITRSGKKTQSNPETPQGEVVSTPPLPTLILTSPEGVESPLAPNQPEGNFSSQNSTNDPKEEKQTETSHASQQKGKQQAVPKTSDVPLVPTGMGGQGGHTAKRMGTYIDEAGNVWNAREGEKANGNLAGTSTTGNEVLLFPTTSESPTNLDEASSSRTAMNAPIEPDQGQHEEGGQPLPAAPESIGDGMDDQNWKSSYEKCSKWKQVWNEIQATQTNRSKPWPVGFQVHGGKLYKDQKLVVPSELQQKMVHEHHKFLGHCGFERMWNHMRHKFEWADVELAKGFAQKVTARCETCQACLPPLTLKTRIKPTPIPPQVMAHVAIDLFRLPSVEYEGQKFDTLVVCVDRHSGWVVAIPTLYVGLTGVKVAKLMLQNFWRPFGIPSVITSDLGSHFVSAWWQTLCAHLGIRMAYGHAYNHQGNGRVERAGLQIFDRLKKLKVDRRSDKVSWVEVLPQLLDRLHDTPGVSGYSPYEILFGRERPLAGIPYQPPRESEDAKSFIERQQKIDTIVAEILNTKHQKEFDAANKHRTPGAVFQAGDQVWYRRPEGSGDKEATRWIGPCVVMSRFGEDSYWVETKPGFSIHTTSRFLKERIEEPGGAPIPLFYHQRTQVEEEGDVAEGVPEAVLEHKIHKGKLVFKVKWEGSPLEEASWEGVESFVPGVNGVWRKYCESKGFKIDLIQDVTMED